MKIVFSLFSRITEKKLLFPHVHIGKFPRSDEINESCAENQKCLSSVIFELIRARYSHFMLGGSSPCIRDSKIT